MSDEYKSSDAAHTLYRDGDGHPVVGYRDGDNVIDVTPATPLPTSATLTGASITMTIDKVGLKDIAGNQINPAKEDGNLATVAAAVASANAFYSDDSTVALTNAYVQQVYGFTSAGFTLTNDQGTRWIKWSWNGINDAGKLNTGESITLDASKHTSIYLKGQTGAEKYRLIAW